MRINEIIMESSGGKNAILYHGTTSKFVASIKKHGLDPNIETKSWGTGDSGGDSYGGVYLTADRWTAQMAAESAARKHGGEPILIKVQYRLGSGSLDEDEIVDTIIGNAKYAVIHNSYGTLMRDILSSISGKPTKVTQTYITQLLQYLFQKFKRVKNLRDDWTIDDKLKVDPQVRELMKKIMESVRVTDMSKSTNVRITRPIKFSGGTRILGFEPATASEELTEAIDLMPMRASLNTVIPDALLDATTKMHELFENGSLNYIKTNAMNWWPEDYKNEMLGALVVHYASQFEKSIRQKLVESATEFAGTPIRVVFANIDSPGQVQDRTVYMSRDYIRQVKKSAWTQLKSVVEKAQSDDDAFFEAIEEITNSDFAVDVRYGLSTKFMQLTSIFIHEMVHIIQNKQQNFKPEVEYRSYLAKRNKKTGEDEFKKTSEKFFGPEYDELSHTDKTALKARYFKLYHASPQEITAFAHNIADQIINDHFLDFVEDEKDMPSLAELSTDVAREVTKKIGKPQTKKDQFVWKRYARIVSQLILQFLDQKKKAVRGQ